MALSPCSCIISKIDHLHIIFGVLYCIELSSHYVVVSFDYRSPNTHESGENKSIKNDHKAFIPSY